MPYYRGDCNYGRGDYYRGDYYRGDPGLFSFIGKALKTVGKAALAGVTGGPLGAALSISRAALGSPKAPIPAAEFAPAPLSFAPGIGTALIPPQPVGTMLPGGFVPGCQLKGTRPNKSGYYKQVMKGDPTRVVYIPKGSVCVKTRRMNVANPRALRRSIRRAQGFGKLARRVLTFVSASAPKGRAKYKRAR